MYIFSDDDSVEIEILWSIFSRGPSHCVSSTIYCTSTVNTQHIQRQNVLVQLGYIWRHVSAVMAILKPTKDGIVKVQSNCLSIDCTLTILFFDGLRMAV